MPELPEVETVCRGLDPVMTGRVIIRADVRRRDLRKPFPKNLAKNLAGQRVVRLSRRAKYILITLGSGYVLVIHLGMSGSMRVMTAGEGPRKHDHFILHLKNNISIAFNDPRRFGLVDLVAEDDLGVHPLFAHLGPEPLGNGFSAPVLAAALLGRKAAIKQAIMDQRIVVGVGNIYASEALFLSGINPEKAACKLTGPQLDRLVRAIRAVLTRAIKAGGSTLRDHRQANGELGYFQNSFSVYDRAGESCPGCTCALKKTGGIKRIVQGGRATFYCPHQQR